MKRNIGLHNLRLRAKAYLRKSRYLKLYLGKINCRCGTGVWRKNTGCTLYDTRRISSW